MSESDQLRVLFVEDDPAVRFGGQQALSLAGIQVEAFGSAEAVRPHLRPYLPGVLVADVRLPGTSGLQLLDEALRADPALPVILITGHGDIAMAVQAMKAGAYDFIEKPFSSDYLVSSVQRALEKRQLTFEVDKLRPVKRTRPSLLIFCVGFVVLLAIALLAKPSEEAEAGHFLTGLVVARGTLEGFRALATTLPRYVANTLILAFGTGTLAAAVGTGAAWLAQGRDVERTAGVQAATRGDQRPEQQARHREVRDLRGRR